MAEQATDRARQVASSPRGLAGSVGDDRLCLALLGVALFVFACALIRTAWLCDDAYITFRVIDNFTHGHGLRWNVADRVQVFTHPLWMMLLAVAYYLTREVFFTALGVGAAVSLLAVWLAGFKHATHAACGLLGVAILFSSRAFVDYSTSGLENPLTHLLLVGFVMGVARASRDPRDVRALSLVAGLAMLNRLDTLLFFLPWLGWTLITQRNRRTVAAMAWGLSPPLVWMAFATFYYGHPLPNTATAKLAAGVGVADLAGRGLHYFWNSLQFDPITLTAIAVAAVIALVRRDRTSLLVMAGVVLYLLYIVRIGGDFMSGRFFAAPLFGSVCVLVRADLPRGKSLALGLAAVAVGIGFLAPYPVLSSGRDYGLQRKDLIDARGVADERGFYFWMSGLLNGRGMPKPVSVVVSRARNARRCGYPVVVEGGVGFLGFVAGPGVHVVDYHGLGDPVLARLPVVAEDPLYASFVQGMTGRPPRDRYRIGHYLRVVPPGYLSHLLGGEDRFEDPQFKRLAEQVHRATRAPLLDRERWRDVARLLVTERDGGIDRSRYRRWAPPRWDEVIGAVPDSPAGHAGLGNHLFRTGGWKPAEQALRHALDRCPDDVESANTLAIIRWRSGDAPEARALCQHAAAIDPDSANVLVGLAHVYAGARETERAVEAFARAMSLDPGLAAIGLSGTTDAWLEAGRHEEAKASLEAYLRIVPANADAHLELGDILDALDDRDGAVASWRAAEELGSRRAGERLRRAE